MSDASIILTAADAEAVRGPTAAGAALVPVPLADGSTFVLPALVLEDPAHQSRWGLLASLPMRPEGADEWPSHVLPRIAWPPS